MKTVATCLDDTRAADFSFRLIPEQLPANNQRLQLTPDIERESRCGMLRGHVQAFFVGALRGNTIRGNTTRNSERKMAL